VQPGRFWSEKNVIYKLTIAWYKKYHHAIKGVQKLLDLLKSKLQGREDSSLLQKHTKPSQSLQPKDPSQRFSKPTLLSAIHLLFKLKKKFLFWLKDNSPG